MQAGDPYLRGLAAWTAGALQNTHTQKLLYDLKADTAKLDLYVDRQMISCSVAELAKTALEKAHKS